MLDTACRFFGNAKLLIYSDTLLHTQKESVQGEKSQYRLDHSTSSYKKRTRTSPAFIRFTASSINIQPAKDPDYAINTKWQQNATASTVVPVQACFSYLSFDYQNNAN